MATLDSIVIVGAGQAGGWVAETLRNEGFGGRIELIGAEGHRPYERPPLSKDVLTGDAGPDSAYLRPADSFAELDLRFHRGVRALAIDRETRRVRCDNGAMVGYDALVLATGSRVRRLDLPGADSERVHYLRTLDDCARLRDALHTTERLLVVGGGWIGLEVAASARKLGLEVTVVEAAAQLCSRVLPPMLREYLATLHRSNGVELRLGCAIRRFEAGADGGIELVLEDGDRIRSNLALIGIGIVPETELAEAAGLEVDNGIVTDAVGRTSDPRVFACGDVTAHWNAALARRIRLESWANAQNQAIATAKAVLGGEASYEAVPWFWSDQYDMNLQLLGLPERWGEPVVRGDMADGTFTVFYLDGARIEAVIAVNSGRDISIGRRLMDRGTEVDARTLADPGTHLKELLKR
jgi:3-phenylpropionate/trans-cinnamate dioxygenase ferredoxin reductase subunit